MSPRESEPAARNPWWIPRQLLGRVPRQVDRAQLRVLGLIALALLFENYDFQLLTATLKHIAEELEIGAASLGSFTSWIRLGGLPAFFVIPFADSIGRRRLFLVSMLGLSLGTLATAFSQTPLQFVLCQVVSRTFMVTAAAMTYVIVAEEFPAAHRGWGVGMLGAVGSAGHGVAALLFAGIDWFPFGWRALYALGAIPLLLLPFFRRELKETVRFQHQAQQNPAHTGVREALRAWLRPLAGLALTYPLRALAITAMGGLAAASHAAVFMFTSFFVQEVHGWLPWQYALMFVLAGGVGIVGNVVAGRLGDAIGRRVIGFIFLSSFPFFGWAFYAGPSSLIPLAWILLVFAVMAGNVSLRAIATEIFPTAHRGTATGWLFLVETIGAFAGLQLVFRMTRTTSFDPMPVIIVGFAILLGAFFIVLVPETRRRELEAISSES
ncbi:MAG: MFS transporter [Deltaproteobacteria bacterium]|nr:MAG: MFS transporter [Deltaproteobacteria bacterium]